MVEWIMNKAPQEELPPPPVRAPPKTVQKYELTQQAPKPPMKFGPLSEDFWELYVDGSSATHAGGIGVLLISPEKARMENAIRLAFKVTNNGAEYEALIAGMKMAKSVMVKKLHAYSGSQLVTKQYSGKFTTKSSSMIKYLEVVKNWERKFEVFTLTKICRTKNDIADGLSK